MTATSLPTGRNPIAPSSLVSADDPDDASERTGSLVTSAANARPTDTRSWKGKYEREKRSRVVAVVAVAVVSTHTTEARLCLRGVE
jgi:hypothetical protein